MRNSRTKKGARPLFRFAPRLEALEARWVPVTVTNLNNAGPGSLRQAILDTPAGGTVDFQSGLSGTITLTGGQLGINKNLAIAGPGAGIITVSGNFASRVFTVGANFTVVISGLTIANGRDSDIISDGGGGIRNQGTLTIISAAVTGNMSTDGAGGGIRNQGTLTIIRSTLSGNSANYGAGGISNEGTLNLTGSTISGNSSTWRVGGISNGGTLTLTGSIVSGNRAGGGGAVGGIRNGGTMTLIGSMISGNWAFGGGAGGGIENFGTLKLTDCTVSDNVATGGGAGGGIHSIVGTLTITDSTISGNVATGGGAGGGIGNVVGTLTLIGSTVSGNSADGGSSSGGIANESGGHITLRNTIVAGNVAGFRDVSGSLNSQGHNLIGIGTGASGFDKTDLVGTLDNPIDPRLGPLEDNGGPTLTHALLPDSPARDAGDNADAPGWDQRGPGFPRIGNGVADIGAYEAHAPVIIAQSPFRTLGPVAGLRVRFDQAMDPATFTPDKITFFSGPLGAIPVTAVTAVPGSGGREFDITFPAQFITSSYAIHIGPDIRDPAGTPMDHDRSGPPGESGDFYLGTFGIEGPRVLRSDPSGTAGGPVERVRVTFNTPMNPASFGPEDILSWVGPLGGIGVLRIDVVPGSGDTEFDIVPAEPLTAAGDYELVIWPDVRDVWDNPMDQNDNLIAGEGIEDGFLGVFAIAGAFPAGAGTGDDAEALGAFVAALRDVTTAPWPTTARPRAAERQNTPPRAEHEHRDRPGKTLREVEEESARTEFRPVPREEKGSEVFNSQGILIVSLPASPRPVTSPRTPPQ